jgi:hypothetical protein
VRDNLVPWTRSGIGSGASTTAPGPSRTYVDWIRRLILHHNKRYPGHGGGGDRGVPDPPRGGVACVGLVRVKKLHESDPAAGYSEVYTHRVQDIGAGTEGGSELDRPPPRPLPSGEGISHWTADTSSPPNGRGLRGGPGHTENLSAMGLSPDALSREYPGAPRQWAWPYVFPVRTRSVDPRSAVVRRHRADEKAVLNRGGRGVRSPLDGAGV